VAVFGLKAEYAVALNESAIRAQGRQDMSEVPMNVLQELCHRWTNVRPVFFHATVTDHREEKVDDIVDAWLCWGNDWELDEDSVYLGGALFAFEEWANREKIAEMIAEDVFSANGTGCHISVGALDAAGESWYREYSRSSCSTN
jgi:hypothetical protein